MANPNDNDNGKTIPAVQASAGVPQRPEHLEEAAADVLEPSADDLDARQADLRDTRRSGPPLPPGEDLSGLAMDEAAEIDEPTAVEEPRPKDR